jgi:hypothetical protein
MLDSVYAVLSVDSWIWHGEIESNHLPSCSQLMVELRMRKREMTGYGWNHYENLGLKRISCASQFTIPDTAGTNPNQACYEVFRTKSGKSYPCILISDRILHIVLILIPYLSLSRPQLYHQHRTQSKVITLCFFMSGSWVDTEYSIPQVQHTLSTVYTEHSIHQVQHIPCTASTQGCLSSLHSHDYELTPECRFSFQNASLYDWPPSASSLWQLKGKVSLSHSHSCELTNWWV